MLATNLEHEQTPLKHPPKQRLMNSGPECLVFSMLDQCQIARISECDDDSLPGVVTSLVGLSDARTFQAVNMNKHTRLLETEELTNFCQRNCVPSRCRPEKTDVYVVDSYTGDRHLVAMIRGGCCSTTNFYDSKRRVIGSASAGQSCHNLIMTATVARTRRTFTLNTPRCGWALWIGKLPIGPCRSVPFDVKSNGQTVAQLTNAWSGFLRECLTDADDYFYDFGLVADPEEKLVLILAAMHIDTLYFSRLCSGLTLRNIALKYFSPVSKVAKAGKFGKALPVALTVAKKVYAGANQV